MMCIMSFYLVFEHEEGLLKLRFSCPFYYGTDYSLEIGIDNQIGLIVQHSATCMCVQVNAATIDGVTPLYNCCASGSVACMELLLQNGAQAHTPHMHFPSALHEACKRGKYCTQYACV